MTQKNIHFKGIYRLFEDGKLVREQENLVVNSGFDILLKNLAGTQSVVETLEIQRLAVGTGSNAVSASDTQLQTEIDRNAVTSFTVTTNTITARVDFSASESVGTLTELGVFVNTTATDTADSGVLFSRVLLDSAYGKASTKTLTVEWQLTISSS